MNLPSPPYGDPIAVPRDQTDPRGKRLPELMLHPHWGNYIDQHRGAIDEKPARKAKVNLVAQGASIGTTAIPMASVSAGLYRLSYFARITTAAGVSSSVTVSFAWTTSGVAQSSSGAALNGNTTASHQFGTLVIRVDANSAISYSTVYASNPAGVMRHSLDLVLEELALD